MTYKIVRRYFLHDECDDRKTIETGLSLEEAQEHCSDPESSSRTCVQQEGLERTSKHGPWFDSYTEE